MSPITVTTRRGDPARTEADTRAVGLFEGEELDDVADLVASGEARADRRKTRGDARARAVAGRASWSGLASATSWTREARAAAAAARA